jgi:hypothetical protein
MNENLKIGNKYTRKDLSEIYKQRGLSTSREGIFSSKTLNIFIFFVDLVKEGKEDRFHFNDYCDGDFFHWDSQTTQHINTPRIQKIIKKEIPIHLFIRVYPKINGKTQPFIFCGRLEYIEHNPNTSKPIHIIGQMLDYDETTLNKDLIEIYNWKPQLIGKSTSNDKYNFNNSSQIKRGEQKKPNYTERKGLVNSRVGQGWYRQEILKKWNSRCSITMCSITEILISSHIKSWSESTDEERLDPNNGILLSPNFDSLFDKHLISFEDDGSIIISEKLSKNDLDILGVKKSVKLRVEEGMKKYLSYHRSKLK